MRRIPALLLSIAVVALLLGGCDERPRNAPPPPVAVQTPAAQGPQTYDEALAQAQARKAALIVDFHAPWCYSCYYMARNVLTGPEWDAVRRRAVILEQDADSPEGAALKARWNVKALPSYLVLDAEGREVGRILGEQTRADFYAAVEALLDRGSALAELERRVVDTEPASIAAAREVLQSYHARYDADGALRWLEGLPPDVRAAVAADAPWLARLRFLRAAQHGDAQACLAEGETVLRAELGCARAYELDRYLGCSAPEPLPRPRLEAQRAAMLALAEDAVFGVDACADQRSIVLVSADLLQALGETEGAVALLERAAGEAQARLDGDLRSDRNLADNLRVYFERLAELTGSYTQLDALMPQLIAAWPDDYVYPFRHGRSLVARGEAAAALPFLQQAAAKAYGVNRLKVAEQRVKALQALDREAEARKIVAEALKANGPWFPEEAAALKGLLSG